MWPLLATSKILIGALCTLSARSDEIPVTKALPADRVLPVSFIISKAKQEESMQKTPAKMRMKKTNKKRNIDSDIFMACFSLEELGMGTGVQKHPLSPRVFSPNFFPRPCVAQNDLWTLFWICIIITP